MIENYKNLFFRQDLLDFQDCLFCFVPFQPKGTKSNRLQREKIVSPSPMGRESLRGRAGKGERAFIAFISEFL